MKRHLGESISWGIVAILLLFLSCPVAAFGYGGQVVWQQGDNRVGKQEAMASTTDSANNVIITGYSLESSEDFYTVKLLADGSGAAFTAIFDRNGGDDRAMAVAVDSKDDVIVAGYTDNGVNMDFQVIKYCGVTRTGPDACTQGAVRWQHSLDGAGNGNDYAVAVAVDSQDSIYVAGFTQTATSAYDFQVIKYLASGPAGDGSPAWIFTRDGGLNREDRITALAVNDTGVAMTGYTLNNKATPDFDLFTVKTDLNGVFLWQKSYDGGYGDDQPWALAMDPAGNVVVSATSYNGSRKEIYTVQYGAADGTENWTHIYAAGNSNEPAALAVDAQGDVYLAGVSFTATGKNDFYTARYAATDGLAVWEEVYNSGLDNADVPVAIAVDEAGDVFVTGYVHKNAADDDFLTLGYKRENGHLLWAALFDGPIGGDDQAAGLAVGVDIATDGDIYVAGWSDQTANGQDDFDLYAVKYDSGLVNRPTGLVATTLTDTEIQLAWESNSDNEEGFTIQRCLGINCEAIPANFSTLTTVPAGTTSYTDTGLTPHLWHAYRLQAYNNTLGEVSNFSDPAKALTTVLSFEPPVWVFTHNGPEDDIDHAYAIAVGPDNNPVATGTQNSPALTSGGRDYYTVKVSRADKSILWDAQYDDPDSELDVATCLAIDGNSDVIVSGYASLYSAGASGNTNDIYTLKYPAAGPPQYGAPELWADQYNGPAGDDDRSMAIDAATDGSNNVVVTGYGKNAQFNDDIYLLKYDPAGNRLWAITPYDGGGNDYPGDVIFDSAGDVLLSGTTFNGVDYDHFLAKYAGSDGQQLWVRVMNHAGDDGLNDLVVDPAGDIYAVGYTTSAGGDLDLYINKFSGVDGSDLWTAKVIDGGNSGYDEAVSIRYDPFHAAVVVASSVTAGTGSLDFEVRRYDPDGNLLWVHRLDRSTSEDHMQSLGMDQEGNVCAAGNADNGGDTDILAICYDADGVLTGSFLYDGGVSGDDVADDLTVNNLGEMYIAGATTNAAGNSDFLIMRADPDVLLAPMPVTSQSTYTSITLNWSDNSITEDGYDLWRADGACEPGQTFTLLGTLPADTTQYVDSGLADSSSYCYRLQAFRNSGKRSVLLEVDAATVVPLPPDGSAGADDSTTITLNWNDNTDGEEGFRILRCQGQGCTNFSELPASPAPAESVTFTDDTVCQGSYYSYQLQAFKGSQWSSLPSAVIADIQTPAVVAPDSLTATRISEAVLQLDWQDANSDTAGYTIERCIGAGCTDFSYLDSVTLHTEPAGSVLAMAMEESAWTGAAGEVTDSSGAGNHGQAKGGVTTMAAGHSGRGASFDGSDDKVVFGYSGGTPTNSFTVAAWVKATTGHQIDLETTTGTAGTSGQRYLFGAANQGSNGGAGVSVGTNGISVYEHGSSYMPALAVYSGSLGTGWNHIVVTYTNKQPRIYLNGQLVHTGLTSTKASVFAPTEIGGGTYGNFPGMIDEVRIYDRALDATEVNDLFLGTYLPTTYTDTNVLPDTTYRYQVTSVKGSSCAWPPLTSLPAAATTTLLTPTPLTAQVTSTTTIDLHWSDGFESEDGFVVERCDSPGCDFSTVDKTFPITGPDVTSMVDDTVCNGGTYSYRVYADRAGVTGWPSGFSNIAADNVTDAVAAPPTLTAVRVSEEEIDLSWTPGTGDEEFFELDRCQGAGCDFSTKTTLTVPAGSSSYQDWPLTPDQSYTYRLRARKPSAVCPWDTGYTVSNEVVTTLAEPDGLTATVTDTTTVDLAWNDQTGNETDFLVERCAGAGCSDYTPVGAAMPDATGYRDADACAGTSYSYRVQAVDQGLSQGGMGCWTRRQALTVSGFVAHSPVRVEVPYQPEMRFDFADLRFYDAVAQEELPYMFERREDGSTATVWFRTGTTNSVMLYYGNPMASERTDPDAVFPFVDTFPGTTIDSAKWVEIDPGGAIAQNDGLQLSYVSQEWTRALISTATFPRQAGRTFYVKIVPRDGPSGDYLMAGWELDQQSNASYTQLVHGLYWNDYYYQAYELGAGKGYDLYRSYAKGTTYEIKVVLKDAGARYYTRPYGDPTWSLVKETSGRTETPLRVAFTQRSHEATVLMAAVMDSDGTLASATLGAVEQSACYPFAHTWASDYSLPVTAVTPLPLSPTGLTATPLSESEIQLDWSDTNGDRDGFIIERCAGAGCGNYQPVATVSNLTYTDSGLDVGTTYGYRVKVYKNSSCTWPDRYSNTIEATTQTPPAPADVTALAVNPGTIRLEWTDRTVSNTAFVVERCAGAGCSSYTMVGMAAGNAAGYTDAAACPDVAYGYRVKAISEDAAGGAVLSSANGGVWSRSLPVVITNFSAAAPVSLTVPYDPLMQEDFRDLRFYDQTAGVELPYMLEKVVPGERAELWFRTGANNSVVLYYGNPQAGMVASATGVFEFYETFSGTTIDPGTWVELDANDKITQNNGLWLTYKNNSWNSALISTQTFARTPGKALIITFTPQDGPTTDALMMGWEQDQTADYNYNRLVHGAYWNDFNPLYVYENGGGYGYSYSVSYEAGVTYQQKIVLAADGADYYIRGGAYPDWQLFHHLTGRTNDPLRIGIHPRSHQGVISKIMVLPDSTTQPTATLGNVTTGALQWESDYGYAAPVDVTPPAPIVPVDFAATLLTETEVSLGWTDGTSYESGYQLDRCAGTGCTLYSAVGQVADAFVEEFDAGLSPHLWNQYGQSDTGSATPPINIVDTVGSAVITTPAGKLDLVTSSTGVGADQSWNSTNIYLADPGTVLGSDDFDIQLDYTLPDGLLGTGLAQYHVHLRLYVAFPVAAGHTNFDQFYIDRAHDNRGEIYNVGSRINDVSQSAYLPTNDEGGKLRLVRQGGQLAAYVWSEGQWQLVLAPTEQLTSGAATKLQVSQHAERNEAVSLHAVTDRLQITKTTGGYSLLDTGLAVKTDYSYRLYPVMAGSCPWEDYAVTTTVTTDPVCPGGIAEVGHNTTEVALQWSDTTSSETGFVVDRCTGIGCQFTDPSAISFTVAADVTGYTDVTAVAGTAYSYQVRAVNDTVPWDSGACGRVDVTTDLPVAATNLQAAWGSEKRIDLSWDYSGGDAELFRIERSDASCSAYTEVGTVAAANLTYSDTDSALTIDTSYCYRIRAYKGAAGANAWYSAYAGPATATTSLLPPVNVVISKINTTTLGLDWQNRTEGETGVEIERCSGSGCDFAAKTTIVLPPATTSYVDDALCAGTVYRYRVHTVNTSAPWDSGFSAPAEGSTDAGQPPHGLAVTENYDAGSEIKELTLSWLDDNLDEDGFDIERCQGVGCGDFTPLTSVGVALNDDDFATGIDPAVWSQQATIPSGDDSTPPVDIADSDGRATITAVDGTVELQVETLTGGNSGWNYARLWAMQPELLGDGDFDIRIDYTLPDGLVPASADAHKYLRFKVNFDDPDGYGPRLADFVSIDRLVLGDGDYYRGAIRVNTVDGINQIQINDLATTDTSGTLRLVRQDGLLSAWVWTGGGWAEVLTATEAMDPGQVPSSIMITPMANRNSTVALRTRVDNFRLLSARTSIVDSGLSAEGTYCYRVIATHAGNGCAWDPVTDSVASQPVCDQVRPAGPTDLQGLAPDSKTVQLSWTANSSGEEGFIIEKMAVNGRFLEVDRVGAGVTSYTNHFGINPETTYTFRVRAFNGDDLSAYSNTLSVTTPPWQAGDGACVQ